MKKAERQHLEKVASEGCVVCRLFEGVDSGPCEIHHIRTGMGTTRASHFQVIGLCPTHHRNGGYGVAIHAGREAFEKRYMTELELMEERWRTC